LKYNVTQNALPGQAVAWIQTGNRRITRTKTGSIKLRGNWPNCANTEPVPGHHDISVGLYWQHRIRGTQSAVVGAAGQGRKPPRL